MSELLIKNLQRSNALLRKASVNPSHCSEEFIYRNIVGDMGESNDSINAILLENIDKNIPINFSLLTTPIKDTPSISKTSTISQLEITSMKIMTKQPKYY